MSREGIRPWVGLAVLAGALLVLFAPLLAGQRVLFWGLPALQFYPWRAFAFTELSLGRIPFWNPYNGGGAPLLANYQTAVFYPPNWLYAVLDYGYAMNLLAVLHVFWGGLGMWVFAGRLGMIPLGRGVSVLCFALGGYGIARVGSFPTADALAWLPWLFWGVLNVLEKRRPLHCGALSAITAMLLLSGHAQTAFYALLGAGAFTLWLVSRSLPPLHRATGLVLAGVGVLLGAGIASIQLLFTGELLAESQRSGGVDFETLTNLSYAPLRLLSLWMPNFFGSPVDGSYLTPGRGVFFEDALYIGVLPLISAVAAVLGWVQWRDLLLESRRAFREVPFWLLLIISGLVLAFGKFTPVYQVLYDYVPTFDAFREPVRWLILPMFALAVLAGVGVQTWGRGARLFYWTRLAGAGGAGIVVLGLLLRQFNSNDNDFVPVLIAAFVAFGAWLAGACLLTLVQPDESTSWYYSPARWQIAVLLFIAADLTWAAQGLNPSAPKEFYRTVSLIEPQGRLYWFADYEETVKFDAYFDLDDYRKATRNWPQARRSLLPNLNMLDRIAIFNNFDPLKPRVHTRYVELIEAQGTAAGALLRAAAVGQVYGTVQPAGWEQVEGENPSYRAPTAPPTAWVVPRGVWVADEDALERRLLAAEWQPEETVMLSGTSPGRMSDPPLTEVSFFDVLRDAPDQKSYRVVTDGGGYLVLANTWYPGWSVKVNGEAQPLLRANLSFMAVLLPAGDAEVTFRYLPTINLLSAMVSLVAMALTLGVIVLDLFLHGSR